MKDQELIEKVGICLGGALCGTHFYTRTAFYNFNQLISDLKSLLKSATTKQKQKIYKWLGRKMDFPTEALKEAVEVLDLQLAVDKFNVLLKENIKKNIQKMRSLEGDMGTFELAVKNALKK